MNKYNTVLLIQDFMPAKLKRGLVAYYPLDEASGNRRDISGYGQTLTDTNTVTGGVGPSGLISLASDFELATSEYLSHTGNARLRGAIPAWSRCGWFLLESQAGVAMNLVACLGATTGYTIRTTAAGTALALQAGNGTTIGTVTNANVLATATWYFFYAELEARTLRLQINLDARATADLGGATYSPGSEVVHLGANITPASYLDGMQAGVGMWDRLLTRQEVAYLYNNGKGRIFLNG